MNQVHEIVGQSVQDLRSADTLRRGVVGALGVLSQAVSEVGPTGSIAVGVGLIAVVAGNGGWLSWALALPVFLLAGFCFSELSKRYSTTGGLPHLIARVSDPRVGLPVGVLIAFFGIVFEPFALMFVSRYVQNFINLVGVSGGTWLIVAGALVGSIVPAYVVYKDVRLAADFMIGTEVVAVSLIIFLLVVVLVKHHGGIIDHAELDVRGASFHSVILGAVFSCLTFVGFESTITLGQEAANPKRSIPFSLYGILIGGGCLFVLAMYVMTLGFAGYAHTSLATSADPLQELTKLYGVAWLNYPLQGAVVIALLAVMVATLNFSARMVYTYAREGLLPRPLACVGKETKTPVNAVLAIFVFNNVVFWIMFAIRKNTLAEFGHISSALTLMYLIAYIIGLVAIAAWMGREHPTVGIAAVLAAAGFGYITYNTLSPTPAAPQNIYNYLALGLTALTLVGAGLLAYARPNVVRRFGSTTGADTALADFTVRERELGLPPDSAAV
jgi:amino acid transporter